MVRVVFFSFDYDDVWRVNQVRNLGAFVGEQRSGFRDKAEYEQVKRSGDAAIKQWIRKQMRGCSVTCVSDRHRHPSEQMGQVRDRRDHRKRHGSSRHIHPHAAHAER